MTNTKRVPAEVKRRGAESGWHVYIADEYIGYHDLTLAHVHGNMVSNGNVFSWIGGNVIIYTKP